MENIDTNEFSYENFEIQQQIIKEYALIVGAMTYQVHNAEERCKMLLSEVHSLRETCRNIYSSIYDN